MEEIITIDIPISWIKQLKFYTQKVKNRSKKEKPTKLLIEVNSLLGYLESVEDLID